MNMQLTVFLDLINHVDSHTLSLGVLQLDIVKEYLMPVEMTVA